MERIKKKFKKRKLSSKLYFDPETLEIIDKGKSFFTINFVYFLFGICLTTISYTGFRYYTEIAQLNGPIKEIIELTQKARNASRTTRRTQ